MKHLIYRILALLFLLSAVVLGQAQRERNYIYLVDATPNMDTPENLWKNTRRWLSHEIKSLGEGKVTIIPFHDEPYSPLIFDIKEISDNQKDGILNKTEMSIAELMKRKSNANHYAALKAAVKRIDNKKDNFIYILTNSAPNANDTENLGRFIRNWCTMKPENVYVFYIMLTRNAHNEIVSRAVNQCPDFFLIDAKGQKLKSICAFMPRDLVVNLQDIRNASAMKDRDLIHQLSTEKIYSSLDGPFPITLNTSDPLFRVQQRSQILDAYGSFFVRPNFNINIEDSLAGKREYCFDIRIGMDTNNYWLVTDSLRMRVVNEPERILYLPATWSSDLQVRHYPKFLFWRANRPDTLHVYLSNMMNSEARRNNASALFQVTISGITIDDYRLFINNHEYLDRTFVLDSCSLETRLDIVFSDYVPAGTHQLVLRCLSSNQLDRINALPPDKYYQSQQIDYHQAHNPLAYLMVISCLLLFAVPSVLFISNRNNGKARAVR